MLNDPDTAGSQSPGLTQSPNHNSSPGGSGVLGLGQKARPKQRARVTRACDLCKKRKNKCNGLHPCRRCTENELPCTFTASYFRGRPPALTSSSASASASASASQTTPITSTRHQGPQCPSTSVSDATTSGTGVSLSPTFSAIPTASIAGTTRWPPSRDPKQPGEAPGSVSGPGPGPSNEPPSRASPEPTQTDLEGHYVGPSSGVAFLLRMQKRLQGSGTISHGTSIFNFGDAPLLRNSSTTMVAGGGEGHGVGVEQLAQPPHLNPTFCLSLSREHTRPLLERYFDFVVPLDRFLHRPTVEQWLDEFYDTMGAMHDQNEAPARLAILFMIFAVAQQHTTPRPDQNHKQMSLSYYLAGTYQLSREQGAVRLASVQARLCQCLWLLAESRINHCWSLFGTVARLAVAIGLHRKRHTDASSQDHVQAECRRRTFWSAYSLDNWLSMALGRPRTFNDDDIDQQLPSATEDGLLMSGLHNELHLSSRAQSVMLAPVAYIQLSQILSGILRDVYSIKARSNQDRFTLIETYTKELQSWRFAMAHFLDTDPYHTAPLVPIFSRQKNTLNLAYWHALILVHRPLLLNNFAKLHNGGSQSRSETSTSTGNAATAKSKTDQSVRECLDAALRVVETVNDIIITGQLFRAYWFTPYYAFSASVILYVYAIQKRNEPEDTYMPHLLAAERCQNLIADIAEEGSLAFRYCIVLKELQTEARKQASSGQEMRKRRRENERHNNNNNNAQPPEGGLVSAAEAQEIQGFEQLGSLDFDTSPTASLADMTSWEQFDSMVMSGFLGFEAMLGGEGTGTT